MSNYICDICGLDCKKKSHFERHKARKFPCKKSVSVLEVLQENIKIKDEFEKIKKENDILKNEKKITNINNINNTTIINENTINITNNFNVIKLTDHGNEDYNKIDIKNILKKNHLLPDLNYISTVIYNIHCNDNFPEYQNIYIPSLSRDKASIYYNGKWINVDKDNTLDKLFNSVIGYVDNITENASNPNIFINYDNEIQKLIPQGRLYSKRNRKCAINNAECILYDNKDKIKNIKNNT